MCNIGLDRSYMYIVLVDDVSSAAENNDEFGRLCPFNFTHNTD